MFNLTVGSNDSGRIIGVGQSAAGDRRNVRPGRWSRADSLRFKLRFEGPYRVVEARPPDYLIRERRRKRLIHGCYLKTARGPFASLASDSFMAAEDSPGSVAAAVTGDTVMFHL